MADSKERLDAMKNYCDKAIMVERELNFWNGLINQANQKLSQYRNEQLRLKKVMSEAQTQFASLGFMSQQKIGEKQAEIQKYKRKCRKSAIVFFVIVLVAAIITGIAGIGSMVSGQIPQSGQGIFLIFSMFLAILYGLFIPLIICIVIYVLNKSRQRNLMREISQNALNNEERRKKAILQDRFEKAEKESSQIGLSQQVLVRQQRELIQMGKEVGMIREQFYARGEIPKGYQNLEAMISFFYYLDNKIVNEIDGADGMYARYHLDCQHREHMAELRGIRHAIEEHERHEQIRHQELMRTIQVYGTAISAQLGRMGNDLSDIRDIHQKWADKYL